MEVLESDHKPVRCKLNVEIANVDRSIRRQELGKIINSHKTKTKNSVHNELNFVPKTDVSTNRIVLQNQETSSFKITNKSAIDNVVFQIICEGQTVIEEDKQDLVYSSRGAFGFPRWLEVVITVFKLIFKEISFSDLGLYAQYTKKNTSSLDDQTTEGA